MILWILWAIFVACIYAAGGYLVLKEEGKDKKKVSFSVFIGFIFTFLIPFLIHLATI